MMFRAFMTRWPRWCALHLGLLVLAEAGMLRAQPGAEFTNLALANLDAGTWQRLTAGGTLEPLVMRLRALGWPDFVIRAIVVDQVRDRFAARTREMAAT